MELELWAELSQAIGDVAIKIKRRPRDTHSTALIVRVHLWSVLHDRPAIWACDPGNWTPRTRPRVLPDQSTISKRTRRDDFEPFLEAVGRRLNGRPTQTLIKRIDGKPLELPNHTTDPDAGWGRGVSRMSIGYKLHAIWSVNVMPDRFAVTSLDVCEKRMAARMIKHLGGGGYVLAPRARPGTGQGHCYQSPHRQRAITMLQGLGDFGRALHTHRGGIERDFAALSSFGCGLGPLPAWVRRIWRVRNWVIGKLLVNAARLRINCKRKVGA